MSVVLVLVLVLVPVPVLVLVLSGRSTWSRDTGEIRGRYRRSTW